MNDYQCSIIPVLPLDRIRSIVTINSTSNYTKNPPSNSPESFQFDRQRPISTWSGQSSCHPPSTSMLILHSNVNLVSKSSKDSINATNIDETITLVASCNPPKLGNDGRFTSKAEGQISLVTISKSNEVDDTSFHVVGVQYSSKNVTKNHGDVNTPSFTTVCLAVPSSNSIPTATSMSRTVLLALNTAGVLYCCTIRKQIPLPRSFDRRNEKKLLNMKECRFRLSADQIKDGRRTYSYYDINQPNSSTVKDSLPQLMFMNTLTVRLEKPMTFPSKTGASFNHCLIPDVQQNLSYSTPSLLSERSRKRKSARNESNTSLQLAEVDSVFRNCCQIYVVASCLNESPVPSVSPPVVMFLSAPILYNGCNVSMNEKIDSPEEFEWSCLAWSFIPGLECISAPMKSIMFVSRSMCQEVIWESISSLMGLSKNNVYRTKSLEDMEMTALDEGVILMGFQDGSLRASLVVLYRSYGKEGDSTLKMIITPAITLLRLEDEFILSLHLVSHPSNVMSGANPSLPLILIIGSMGTILALSSLRSDNTASNVDVAKFVTLRPSIPNNGRLISMSPIDCELEETSSSSDLLLSPITLVNVSFVLTYDHGESYFLCETLCFGDGYEAKCLELEENSKIRIFRLPVPCGFITTVFVPSLISCRRHKDNQGLYLFALRYRKGKLVVCRISSPHERSLKQEYFKEVCTRNKGLINEILSRTGRKNLSSKKLPSSNAVKSSKAEEILSKLTSAKYMQSTSSKKRSCYRTAAIQRSLSEIHEATNHFSLIRGTRPPIKHFFKYALYKPHILDCAVNIRKSSFTKHPMSIHTLHSCLHLLSPMLVPKSIDSMTPICYRQILNGDYAQTKVFYAGTATSHTVRHPTVDRELIDGDPRFQVSVDNLLPVSIYASLFLEYGCINAAEVDWYHSESMVELLHSAPSLGGSAARMIQRKVNNTCADNHFGLVVPFDIGNKSVLTLNFTSENKLISLKRTPTSSSVTGGNLAGSLAEKIIEQWYQGQGSHSTTPHLHKHPSFIEKCLIRHHSKHRVEDFDVLAAKYYCSSNTIQLLNSSLLFPKIDLQSQKYEYLSNLEYGPASFVLIRNKAEYDDESSSTELSVCGFAVGSNISPDDAMSLIPLLRCCVVQELMNNKHDSEGRKSRDEVKLLDLYRGLLLKKETYRISKHVYKSVENLLSRCESNSSDHYSNASFKDVMVEAISLYETIRTLPFIIA